MRRIVMNDSRSTNELDASLLPFLQATDDRESEEQLAALISEEKDSTINGIVRSKLRVSLDPSDSSHNNQDALEIVGDVQTALVGQLWNLKSNNCATISNFHGYVASVTFNACHQYLRRKYPERSRLRNKLRYLLTHHQGFVLRQTGNGEWICSVAPNFRAHGELAPWAKIQKVLENQRVRNEILSKAEGVSGTKELADLLTTIFGQLQAPVILDDLVGIVADLRGIKDNAVLAQTDEQRIDGPRGYLMAPPILVSELEQRAHLQKVWAETCQLPLRHRAALLLNLKDRHGASTIELLPFSRIATIREIAEVLAFPPEDFARIWNELPWDDLTIARHLQLTRQQVINLRQSARARLARRIKSSSEVGM